MTDLTFCLAFADDDREDVAVRPRHTPSAGSGRRHRHAVVAPEPIDDRTRLCGRDGHTVVDLDVAAWSAEADAVERRRLAEVAGPVLDIGCGPGRLVVALGEQGVPALGVDASPVAVGQAVERRAAALVRSVFDPLPGTGRWRTALLFDGNVGIGGDPLRLLHRVSELLAPGGRVLVEAAAPPVALHRFDARVERGTAVSDWFPWAQVGVDALLPLTVAAGFDDATVIEDDGRWFVDARRPSPARLR